MIKNERKLGNTYNKKNDGKSAYMTWTCRKEIFEFYSKDSKYEGWLNC